MKPEGTKDFRRSRRWVRVARILAAVIPLYLFVVLRWLREPESKFRQVSIGSQSPDEAAATLARIAREQPALSPLAHMEMLAVTLFALSLLYFFFKQTGVQKWTKYSVIASAVVSGVLCWSLW